jgi:Protein of unknown function (DUF2924)
MAVQTTLLMEPVDPAIEAELRRLMEMPIAQLRPRYAQVFRSDPPKAFGPDLLRRSIAHRIQEKAYGGLSRSAQRLLDQMIKAYSAKPGGRIVLPRRIKLGSVLVREWKGKSHRVMVLAEGFAYDGRTFGNLSEIAVLITGTRWKDLGFSVCGPRHKRVTSLRVLVGPMAQSETPKPHQAEPVIWAAEMTTGSARLPLPASLY